MGPEQMADFDPIAAEFDRFRALPAGVPAAVREALWSALGGEKRQWILDLGAGTGRVGEAFATAGDQYVAVDASARMLAHFAAKAGGEGTGPQRLVQADGCSLPFPDATFDAVLLVQVVSGTPGWRRLLAEARRVLRPAGAVALGQAVGPPDSLDDRMRAQLALILAEAGVDARRPGAGRDEARGWLGAGARRSVEVVAASWEAARSPRDFLARHATGARFNALPQSVRDDALRRLADWSVGAFGGLDATRVEAYAFLLDVWVYN
jgi:SAM-dependent methyltransferase